MSENIIEEYSGEVKLINAGAKGKIIDLSKVPIAECYDCSILEPKQVLFNIVKPNPLMINLPNNIAKFSIEAKKKFYCDNLVFEKDNYLFIRKNNIEVKISNFYIKPVRIEKIFYIEGMEKEKIATARRLLSMGLSEEQVSTATELPLEEIQKLRK